MKIAILGRQPSIGIAELESVFGGEKIRVLGDYACIIETEKNNVSHFGSILKTGQVVFEVNSTDWHDISKKITQIFERDFADFSGKITLGISSYGLKIRANEISELGRATQGVKIMKVQDETKIVAMAKVIKGEDETSEDKSEEQIQL